MLTAVVGLDDSKEFRCAVRFGLTTVPLVFAVSAGLVGKLRSVQFYGILFEVS